MNNLTQKSIADTWSQRKLGSMLVVKRGGSPRPIEKYITDREDGLNWLKIGDIETGAKYVTKTSCKIIKDGLSKTTLVKHGDFILSNSMSYGRPYIMNINACIHDGWLTFQNINEDIIKRDFLYYLLLHPKTQSIFQSISAGSGVQNLKKETVAEVNLLIPPPSEQERIVGILEIWDKAIEKLIQKIKIKKKIKRSLMQKLLTGAVRLSGFTDEWKIVELGTLLEYERPDKYIVKSTSYCDKYKTPVLTANKSFVLGYTDESEGIYKNIPVIIFDDFTVDNKYVDFSFKVKSSAIKILKTKNDKANLKFVFEKMQLIKFTVGEHKRNYISEYQYIDVKIPDIKEQNAIANVLTVADNEIDTLKKELVLLKKQKKYLLNNLITGTIRTPENLLIRNK